MGISSYESRPIKTRPPRACRPFGIADAMVLVAASAAIFLIIRLTWRMPGPGRHWASRVYFGAACSLLECATTPLLLAGLPLRLRGPRPSWRRICRQPGFAASLAAAASLIPGLMPALIEVSKAGWFFPGPLDPGRKTFPWFYENTTLWTLASVVGAWSALAASGRWRAEPGWIDRLGRVVGFAWIGAALLTVAYNASSVLSRWL